MLVNAYARAGLVLVVAALVAGCRTNTDRIRVLEAERADAERRNRELMHAQAELRAEKIKAEGDAESQRARLEALEAQLEIADHGTQLRPWLRRREHVARLLQEGHGREHEGEAEAAVGKAVGEQDRERESVGAPAGPGAQPRSTTSITVPPPSRAWQRASPPW